MAEKPKRVVFQNDTKHCYIGHPNPNHKDHRYLHNFPFYMAPGDVKEDPEGKLWRSLRDHGGSMFVRCEDPDELKKLKEKLSLPETAVRADGFFGAQHILVDVTKEYSLEGGAPRIATAARVAELEKKAASHDALKEENDRLKALLAQNTSYSGPSKEQVARPVSGKH